MPFARPTRSELVQRIRTEFETRLEGADGRLRRSLLDVTARGVAAVVDGLYGFQQYRIRQKFPDTAEAEFIRREAGIYGIAELGEEIATGNSSWTGSNGATIPDGTVLRRGDGIEYETTADGTIVAGVATIPIQARFPGEAGNADEGVKLTPLTTIPGVDSSVTVATGGLTGGRNPDTDESLRARLIQRLQEQKASGRIKDYIAQAKLYPGVTKVFVHPQQYGDGTVGVAPMLYGRVDPFPTSGEVDAIQALMDDPEFAAACATVTVYALDAEPIAITASITPDSPELRARITAELDDMIRREDVAGGKTLLSHIRETFSLAAGETDHDVTVPASDPDLAGDLTKIHTLGTITWS